MGTGGIIFSFAKSLNTSRIHCEELTEPWNPSLWALSMLQEISALGCSDIQGTRNLPKIHHDSVRDCCVREREDALNVPELLFDKVMLLGQFGPCFLHLRAVRPFDEGECAADRGLRTKAEGMSASSYTP